MARQARSARAGAWRKRLGAAIGLASALGCAGPPLPQPAATSDAYAEAVKKKDAHALHQLLTERARQQLSEQELARLLRENRAELEYLAAALSECRGTNANCQHVTTARLLYRDGSEARLQVEAEQFKLVGAGALPAAPPTPEAALAQLRWALERRSLPALLGLLEQSKRAELADNLEVLTEALRGADLGLIEVRGDRARVDLPGGVRVLLRRVDGSWWIEDIQ